jgi:polygalacturonase
LQPPADHPSSWDIYRSSNVAITNSYIVNGDDCVSFKPNTTNTLVENLYCQGSHGISVGSLGQYAGTEDIVANIFVKNITMVNAENGVRIRRRYKLYPEHHVPRFSLRNLHVADYHRPVL